MGVWFFCLIGVPLVSAETPEFKLSAGDRVLLVGGGVLARDAHTGYLETELLRRFPKQAVLVRNTAESGESLLDDTEQEFARFQRDLEILRPTVVLIGFGWEDSRRGVDKLADFLAKYGKRLDAVAAQKARAVLVSPIRHEDLGGDRPDPKEHNQALRAYVDGIAHLAQSRHLPFVNLFDFLAVPPGGTGPRTLTENGTDLSPTGYWRAAAVVAESLGYSEARWAIDVDVGTGKVRAESTKVTEVRTSPTEVGFLVEDPRLPRPLPRSFERATGRWLRFTGLARGRFALTVDEEVLTSGTSQEWAKGVELSPGPEFQQADELRARIVEKNGLFQRRWRLRGARGLGQSTGRAVTDNPVLPRAVERLDKQLIQRDAAIVDVNRTRGHRYRIRQVAQAE